MILSVMIIVAGIVAIFLGTAAIVNLRDRRIKELMKESDEYHTLALKYRAERNEAHKALRAIANGAGSPQIEAQIVLDNHESKETL